MWHCVAIRCVGCVCAPVRESLCLLWRETHTKDWGRGLPRDRKWRKKGRENRESSRQRRAEETNRTVIPVLGKDGQQKEAVREDSQRWVGILVAFVEVSRKIHAVDSLQMCGECKASQNSLSFAWSWPKSVFVCLFFFSHPLGCALCICNLMCDTPGREPLEESQATSSLI